MSSSQSSSGTPWTGWVFFAGIVLVAIGIINVIQGLVAILKQTVYVLPSSNLVVTTNYKTWGWALLIWGIVMALAGFGLFSASTWARWFGIIVVFVNLIGQFAFFPAFPLWSLVVIAIDIAVLIALTVHWPDVREDVRGY
jgi:hypothetical protein